MSRINLSWKNDSNIHSHQKIYQFLTMFDSNTLPSGAVTIGRDVRVYEDVDVVEGLAYYYAVATVDWNGVEYLSDVLEVEAIGGDGDPHWDKVVALLHFDGNFTDETGRSWTPSGGSVIGNIGVFGSLGYLHIPSQQAKIYSTTAPVKRYDHFTMEAFVRFGDINQTLLLRPIFSQTDGGSSKQQAVSINTTTSRLQFHRQSGVGSVVTMDGVTTVSENTWYHVALSFDGSNIRLFLNGNLEATASNADGWYDVGHMEVGCYTNPSYTTYGFLGDIDEVRITNGVARYTENFIPPTEPFPNYGA